MWYEISVSVTENIKLNGYIVTSLFSLLYLIFMITVKNIKIAVQRYCFAISTIILPLNRCISIAYYGSDDGKRIELVARV